MPDEHPMPNRRMLHRQVDWLHVFAEVDCAELPLYRALALALVADARPVIGADCGTTSSQNEPRLPVLGLLELAPPGQWRPILLLAALHDVVLQHPDDPFARNYPTVGGAFDEDARSEAAFLSELRSFVDRHRTSLTELIATRATQTNEVNRSCLWFAAVRQAVSDLPDRPVALVEIGPSAGLNLRFDRYSYTYTRPAGAPTATLAAATLAAGNAGAAIPTIPTVPTVSLTCELRGDASATTPPLHLALPPIVERVGIDLHRVDIADPADRRWLKACIWPEESERHQRFDAAMVAALVDPNPPRLVIDDAIDGIADVLDELPDDAHVVVISSWVMAYIERERRAAFERILDVAGSDRSITWLSAESEGALDWVPRSPAGASLGHTVVGMARWRNGTRDSSLVAHCHPHLAWMEWLA